MRLRLAIPILLTALSTMLSGIGLSVAQPQPPGGTPRGGVGDTSAKLTPFKTGLEGRRNRRTPPGARVDFTLEDADLPNLVRLITEVTGKRFILPAKARAIKATVASTRPVTAGEAYRAFLSILELNGLTVVPSGRYLKIVESTGAELRPLPIYIDGQATPRDDRFITRMHRLSHISAEDVATLLGHFKSREGNLTAYAPTNTVIMTDTGANIRRMLRILQEIDVARTGEQIWVEEIHHSNAEELANLLREIFPSAGGGTAGGRGASPGRPPSRPPPARPGARPGGPAGSAPATVGARNGESRITSIIPDERTNSLIILATERAYLRILEVIRALDVPVEGEGSLHVHQLQYADAEVMAQTLQSLISGQSQARGGPTKGRRPGRQRPRPVVAGQTGTFDGTVGIQEHKPTNSLLITASLHDYIALRRLIDRLDAAPRQVFIEAVIMELSVTRSQELGLSFHGGAPVDTDEGQALSLFGFNAGNTATPPSAAALQPLASGLAVGVRGPVLEGSNELIGVSLPSFGVLLNAIANSSDTDILSTPNLIAMDNEEAEINVGSNVPLQTSGLFGLGSAGGLGAAAGGDAAQQLGALGGLNALGGGFGGGIQRQDVGTKIKVTPHINDAGEIRLEIELERSDVGDNPQGNLGVVPINQSIAKTQVLTRDQQTVVVGGLIRDTVSTSETKVPILGDIPLLGALFRNEETTVQKRNLILFLTPYVVRSQEDMRAIYERRIQERQQFIDRYFVFQDRDYRPAVDYSRTRGLLSEILNRFHEIDEEQRLNEELRERPPPEHVPRPPIGASPPGGGDLIITPEGTNPSAPPPASAPANPPGSQSLPERPSAPNRGEDADEGE